MKVILIEDVKNQGRKGDIVSVADSYAKNVLIRNGLAIEATASEINKLKQQKNASSFHEEEKIRKANELKDKIENCPILVKSKVSPNGKLFGAITTLDIATLLEKNGFTVDKRKIELDSPIKTVGIYSIKIRVFPKIVASLCLTVEAD